MHTPKATGTYLKSEMIRVDRDFAQLIRKIARESFSTVTEVTRTMYLDMQTEEPSAPKQQQKAASKSATGRSKKVAEDLIAAARVVARDAASKAS